MGLNDDDDLEKQLGAVVKQMIKWRSLYEGAKAREKNTALWLEGHRRLAREKGIDDLDRLLEILGEIEVEQLVGVDWYGIKETN